MDRPLRIPEKIALDGMKSAYSAIRHTQFTVKCQKIKDRQIDDLTAMADDYYDCIQGSCRMLARWKARRLMRMIEEARNEENLSGAPLPTRWEPIAAAVEKIVSGY